MDDTPNNRINYVRTALIYLSFLGVGSGMTVLGSSILDLQIQVQEEYETIAHVIPVRAAGLVVGYFFAGLIGERMNPQVLMFLTNIFAGVTFISAPWNHHLTGLMIDFFLSGVFLAANKVCCNQFIFSMWGEKSPLFIQFLYMFYDTGSFLAPFWTKPFILRSKSELLGNTAANVTSLPYKPSDVKIQYPIMIVGFVYTVAAFGFLILHYTKPYIKPLPKHTVKKAPSHVKQFDGKRSLKWFIIIMMCLFTHAAQSTTDLIGEMGPSFAVHSELKLPNESGPTLVSIFWGFFTIYRVIFIVLLMYTTAEKAKIINVLLLLVSLVVLVPHANTQKSCLYAGIILLGFGMCPIFAATYGSITRYFPVTSRMTAAFFISTCVGHLIYPWVVSQYIRTYPVIFLYVIAGLVVATCILTTIIPFIGQKYLQYAVTNPVVAL